MIKLLGSILIIGSASWVGLAMAGSVRREERLLHTLAKALERMQCEICTRLTPVGDLCRQAAEQCEGIPARIFQGLALDIRKQEGASLADMMHTRLCEYEALLPSSCQNILTQLGQILGEYEPDVQTKALQTLVEQAEQSLAALRQGRSERCRSYGVMGVCAGCALAILLV